jgi:hypothetical protein
MQRKITIGLDFDGTIVEDKFPDIGESFSHAIQVLRRMADAGMILVLWTCREDEELEAALQFCYNHGINVITAAEYDMMMKGPLAKYRRKIPCDYYIENRTIYGEINWLDIEYFFFGDEEC